MQCEQIRPLLGQYADGSLPGYKVSWVVQHLAGCTACAEAARTAQTAAQRKPAAASPRETAKAAKAAVAAESQRRPAEANLEPVQRPVPRWLRWVTVLLIAAAAGGAVWLFLGNPAPHQGQQSASSGAAIGSVPPVA